MKEDIEKQERINKICESLQGATIPPLMKTAYRGYKVHEQLKIIAANKAYNSPHLRLPRQRPDFTNGFIHIEL